MIKPIIRKVSKIDKGKYIYGVIWDVPKELIGKDVVILPLEEWNLIEHYLKLLKKVIEQEHIEVIKKSLERLKIKI